MKKLVLIFALLIACTSALCACGEEPGQEAVVLQVDSEEQPQSQTEPGNTAVEAILYIPDSQAEYFDTVPVSIEDSPQALINALIENSALPQGTSVNSFAQDETEDGKKIILLDLSAQFAQAASSAGTTGEYLLLGSLTNTFLEYYGAELLSLSCDGNILETGHNIYDYPLSFYQSQQ